MDVKISLPHAELKCFRLQSTMTSYCRGTGSNTSSQENYSAARFSVEKICFIHCTMKRMQEYIHVSVFIS